MDLKLGSFGNFDIKELSLKLGVKLTINDKNNKGNIKIEYRNIDQRENIIKKLTGE